MKKKVLLVTEYLNPPYDEGIKKTVYNLFVELNKNYRVKVICRYGIEQDNVVVVNTNKLFYDSEIKKITREFNPDTLIYFPFQSSTFASYIRLKILSGYAKYAKSIFIALQPKVLKNWQKPLISFLKPKMALTPSPTLKKFWSEKNIKSVLIPLLTDLSKFKPLEIKEEKIKLREKYKLPLDAFVISHMGHLNEGRNLRTLIPVQKSGNQIVIVVSSSTPLDAVEISNLKSSLENEGVIIINEYIDAIEEVYQLSDLYVFPVVDENSSIGMPLSVLEARACGTPVLTTDYGSLKEYLADDYNGIFYATPSDFNKTVDDIKKNNKTEYIKTDVNKLNEHFYNSIFKLIN